MASDSDGNKSESKAQAASEALRRLCGDLVRVLQEPELLAWDLYAESIVPRSALGEMNVVGIPAAQKRMKLLSFVIDQVAVDPERLPKFVNVLKKQPCMVEVAERLERTYASLLGQTYIQSGRQVLVQPNTASLAQPLKQLQAPGQLAVLPLVPSPQPTPSALTAIETYTQFLMSVYLRQKFPTYGKWHPDTSKSFINLALIKKQKMSKQQMDHYTRQTIRGDIDDIIREKESISIKEIGRAKQNTLPKCILVEGAPGVGKSTLAWKLCRKWSKGKLLQQYRVVVLLRLRDKRVREAKTVSDLFYYYNRPIQQTVVEEIQATGGRGVLLLFEGYDELPANLRTSSSIFLEVIKGQELLEATVLVTSRPSASGPLYMECRNFIDQHVEILGFTQYDIQSYFENCIGHDNSLLQGLQRYLTYYPHIRSMLYIPLNCAIVVEVYRVHKCDETLIPKTWTDLYSSLLRSLLLRYLDDHPVHQRQSWKSNSFRDLPPDVYQQLCELGRIAYEGILQDQQVIFSDLPSDFSSLGLMQCVPELYVDEVAAESFNFLHLTLQEYMAALHLSEQPVEKQIEIFKECIKHARSRFDMYRDSDDKSHKHFRIVVRFLAGLRKFADYYPSSIRSLLFDTRFSGLTFHYSSKLEISLDGLHWIFEAQDTSNVCEAIGMSLVIVDLGQTRLTSFDCFVLGYCVSHSNCPWEIDLRGCGIGDEEVEMFIRGAVEGEAKHSGYISVMNIGWNKITSAGLNQLLKIPKLLKLRKLDLSSNPLGREGTVSLLKSPFVDNLEDLNLDNTWIGVEGATTFAEKLLQNTSLRILRLSHTAIGLEGTERLIVCLLQNSTLETLYLPFEHKSFVETSEVYRRVVGRIVWRHLRLDRPKKDVCTTTIKPPPVPLPLEEDVDMLRDPTHQSHSPSPSHLPQPHMMEHPRGPASESERDSEDRPEEEYIIADPGKGQSPKLMSPHDHKYVPKLREISETEDSKTEDQSHSNKRSSSGSTNQVPLVPGSNSADPQVSGKPSQAAMGVHTNVPPPAPLSSGSGLELDSSPGLELDSGSGIDFDTEVSPSKEPVTGEKETDFNMADRIEENDVDLLDSEIEEWETPPTSPTHPCSVTFPNPGPLT